MTPTMEKQQFHIQAGHINYLPQPEISHQSTINRLTSNEFERHKQALFNGEPVNTSEQRAAWHTACREPNPNKTVSHYQQQMQRISHAVRQGKFGKLTITDVINIGIGGSDLGPKLVCEAFADVIDGPSPHFVSNLDSYQLNALLATLKAESTLVIVTSKSFQTLETLENMQLAKHWLEQQGQDASNHIIAISSNADAPMQHGIKPENCLLLPEWVGGRFSVWSSVGLIISIAFGYSAFSQLLAGAHTMDQHFAQTSFDQNIPEHYASMLYNLINQRQIQSIAILPYAHTLRSLTEYLQQLFMESLGKSTNLQGKPIQEQTGPLVFGGPGTNCQHSFQQLIMQGTHPIMADFILPLQGSQQSNNCQTLLAANCITQLNTMRHGHTDEQQPQKSIRGNQAANLFIINQLTFESLGSLLAMYEHAVFTLGYLFNINPFDQWGVEYAKTASIKLAESLKQNDLTLDRIKTLLKNPAPKKSNKY